MPDRYHPAPLEERFWSKVDKNGPVLRAELGPCFVWTASLSQKGYGRIWVRGFRWMVEAHRVAFFLAHGSWPKNDALHLCDNPACVRAEHIIDGTHAENMADCVKKGRRPAKLNEAAVHAIRESSESVDVLAVLYGVSKWTIYDARSRKRRKYVV